MTMPTRATVTVFTGQTRKDVTGNIVRIYPNGDTLIEDAKGIRYVASKSRSRIHLIGEDQQACLW